MWHASVARHGRRDGFGPAEPELAYRALQSVGDASLGEWTEVGRAFHLRRRLSMAEVLRYAVAVRDIRGTPEVDERLAPLRAILGPDYTE